MRGKPHPARREARPAAHPSGGNDRLGSDRLLLLVRGNKRIHHACLDPGAKTLQQDLRAIGKTHAILEKVTVEPRKGNDLMGRYAKRGPGALRNILKHQLGVVSHAYRRRGIAGGNEPNSAARKTVCHILLAFPRGSASISFQRVVAHDLHPRFVAVVLAPTEENLNLPIAEIMAAAAMTDQKCMIASSDLCETWIISAEAHFATA